MAKPLSWAQRMVLTLMSSERRGGRHVILAMDHTPRTKWRLLPGGRAADPRIVRLFLGYGYLQELPGPLGLPMYGITQAGIEALRSNVRPS